MDGFTNILDCPRPGFHPDGDLLDEVGGFRSDDMTAQDLSVQVDDDLDEADGFRCASTCCLVVPIGPRRILRAGFLKPGFVCTHPRDFR